MKKIMNQPDQVVSEMLEGLEKINPQVRYIPGFEVIARRNREDKVGIVSGGGSGHEPAHAGYVGTGMLDAAVCGNVFASPSPDRILEGIQAADAGKGVLLIVKNYSGDIMNFEMAMELAKEEGTKLEMVVVKDDVAVPDSTFSTGRRGIAGTVFVHKIAGARAQEGASLEEVAAAARGAAEAVRSMGVALTSCTLPAVGTPGFALADDEMEVGMGIHGEPGVEKTPVKTAQEIAQILVGRILEDYDYRGKETAVLINGLGATPWMELAILTREVDRLLAQEGVVPYRYLTGNFMTSLDMAGASLSLLELNEERKRLLDAPCDTLALKIGGRV